jgi:hypothetical protein
MFHSITVLAGLFYRLAGRLGPGEEGISYTGPAARRQGGRRNEPKPIPSPLSKYTIFRFSARASQPCLFFVFAAFGRAVIKHGRLTGRQGGPSGIPEGKILVFAFCIFRRL